MRPSLSLAPSLSLSFSLSLSLSRARALSLSRSLLSISLSLYLSLSLSLSLSPSLPLSAASAAAAPTRGGFSQGDPARTQGCPARKGVCGPPPILAISHIGVASGVAAGGVLALIYPFYVVPLIPTHPGFRKQDVRTGACSGGGESGRQSRGEPALSTNAASRLQLS